MDKFVKIQRVPSTRQRVAIIYSPKHAQRIGWGITPPHAYDITDASLARLERLATQKTTRRFVSLGGVNVIENTYNF